MRILRLALCVCGLVACEPDSREFNLVSFDDLPLWHDDASHAAGAMQAFHHGCEGLARRNYQLILPPSLPPVAPEAWKKLCLMAAQLNDQWTSAQKTRLFFENFFTPFEWRSKTDSLLTGYYEPQLDGALTQKGQFNVPLYGRPRDLVRMDSHLFGDKKGEVFWGKIQKNEFVPYETRGEIMKHGLAGRAPVLAWVANETDAFFLAVQGSGRIRLEDGEVMRLGYEARNGYPYRSLGKKMAQEQLLENHELSYRHIRAFFDAHPHEMERLLAHNPSYIFFRILDVEHSQGPVGSFGVPLVAEHSLAIDPSFVPLGLPLWIATLHPHDNIPMARLMMALDTGSAIKGARRGDIFWGTGESALTKAAATKQQGQFFILIPKMEALHNLP